MDRLKVGVVFGGSSEEHPVSVKSARHVAANLDRSRYEPYFVGITRDGAWRLCDDGPGEGWDGGRRSRSVVLSGGGGKGARGLLVLEDGKYDAIELDVVFPVLHGRFGEDGAIQGLLELSGIPYVGCDVQSSAICLDKSLTYTVVRAAGISTPNFWILGEDEDVYPGRFEYPVFVKPARSGSSFGVSKVSSPDEMPSAVAAARRYDAKVLVEEAVRGSEVGCAVLGNGADPLVGEPDQITLSHGFFQIHQEDSPETGSANSTVTVPAAGITAEAHSLVRETAIAVYRALGCRGLARVDLFLTQEGEVVLNEVNTLPGLTSYSRYPRMMEAAGMPLAEVIDRLLTLAMAGRDVAGRDDER